MPAVLRSDRRHFRVNTCVVFPSETGPREPPFGAVSLRSFDGLELPQKDRSALCV